ncbi:phage terminase large subunit [Phormidium tenue FACHB-886]|nr:phage terminase large subunit [Phormidium tenue FACHB-886]
MATKRVDRRQELIDELELQFELNQPEEDDCPQPLSFREFVDRVYPKYKWYHHCAVLANVLQEVADGKRKRVMVFMPPRAGKSQLTSKLFPGYMLYRYPEKWVGLCSYAAELAYTLSRASRDAYREIGGQFKDDANAVKNWETLAGGGCWAAGVGGAITGKGFGSVAIIDDPLKNAEESLSDRIKEKQREWYGSTFYTRAEPEAAIVVVQTRWAEDDLSGWLLSQESEDEPEHWHVVNFESIKEETPPKFPATCTVEPDWRSPGEALNPERFDVSKLNRFKKRLGSYFFNALYQQRPSPLEGEHFKRNWWQFYRQPPAQFDQLIQSWDCAFKETKSSDFVVGQVWGKKDGYFYLLHQVRDRMDINATLTAIRALSAKYPNANAKLVEDKANGSAVIDLLKREIPGLIAVQPEGGKLVRAVAIAPFVQAGNVFLPDPSIAAWVGHYLEEFATFPNGKNDDQVDSTSQALNWLQSNQAGFWGVTDDGGWSY